MILWAPVKGCIRSCRTLWPLSSRLCFFLSDMPFGNIHPYQNCKGSFVLSRRSWRLFRARKQIPLSTPEQLRARLHHGIGLVPEKGRPSFGTATVRERVHVASRLIQRGTCSLALCALGDPESIPKDRVKSAKQ
jgi:hypothetical protein